MSTKPAKRHLDELLTLVRPDGSIDMERWDRLYWGNTDALFERGLVSADEHGLPILAPGAARLLDDYRREKASAAIRRRAGARSNYAAMTSMGMKRTRGGWE